MGAGAVDIGTGFNTRTVTVNGSGSLTVGGQITGGNYLRKDGPGTLILANYGAASSYGMYNTVAAGTLVAMTPGSLYNYAGSDQLGVFSGATLAVGVGGAGQWGTTQIGALLANDLAWADGSRFGMDTTGGDFTYGFAIPNAGGYGYHMGFVKLGANKLTLTSANTYSGPTNVVAGTLQLNDGGTLGSGGTVTNNSALVFNYTTGTVPSQQHHWRRNPHQGRRGTLFLDGSTGSLTYTGMTTILAGTVKTAGLGSPDYWRPVVRHRRPGHPGGKAVLDYTVFNPGSSSPPTSTLTSRPS